MSIGVPVRLANGVGNYPDADKWMTDYDYLTALIHGNFTLNGGMENWNVATTFTNPATGTAVADNWTTLKSGTTGATADVSREATIIDTVGTYSMKVNITGAGSSDSIWDVHQAIASPTRFRSESVLFGARIWCATANKLRVKISDGITTAYSTYHTGNSQWQTLNAILAISGSAASVTITVEANPSDFTGAFYIDSIFTYVVPAQITATAKAALTYLQLFSSFLATSGGVMTGDITGLVDAAMTPATAGSTATGLINRLSQIINQIKNGFGLTNWYDAVTAALLKAGGAMSGAIAMGGNKVTGLGAATTNGDAVPYEQLPAALTAGQLPGTATNNNASAGNVGEYVSASADDVNITATNTGQDITTISLTAGDWNVTAMAKFAQNGATWTQQLLYVATGVPGNSLTGSTDFTTLIIDNASSSTTPVRTALTVANVRVSIASTTTIQAKVRVIFSAGTPQASVGLSARRIR